MAAAVALLAGACGGGGSSPTTPSPAPTPTPAAASKVVVLDSGNFESLVLAATRPSVVEFHSPT
jgi:hypothetical protein